MTDHNEVNQYTLDNLNMRYINLGGEGCSSNEETDTGAILKCSHSWTILQLQPYLSGYDYDMLESVKDWLANDSEIAEGGYLEVWI